MSAKSTAPTKGPELKGITPSVGKPTGDPSIDLYGLDISGVSDQEAVKNAILANKALKKFDNQEFSSLFHSMLQDANGSAVYDSVKVQIGHVEAKKFLMIPKSLKELYEKHPGEFEVLEANVEEIQKVPIENYSGVTARKAYDKKYLAGMPKKNEALYGEVQIELLKLHLMNYISLKEADLKPGSAMHASAFRARIAALGGVKTLLGVEKEKDDLAEYVIVEDTHPTFGDIVDARSIQELCYLYEDEMSAIMAYHEDKEKGSQWMTRHTEHFVAATEYAFRVRGHHYKSKGGDSENYDELYTKYLNASFQGNYKEPDDMVMEDMFHAAIHPFKLKTLVALVHHFAMKSKLSDAALLRLSGAPAGHAIITTTMAALDTMSGELWYGHFENHFKELIKTCNEAKNQILAKRYAYHQSAALYGLDKLNDFTIDGEKISINDVKAKISILAASCQGLIQALKDCVQANLIDKFALSNARCLEKASSNAPLMTLKVNALITASVEAISNSKSVDEMAKAAISGINAEEIQSAGTKSIVKVD